MKSSSSGCKRNQRHWQNVSERQKLHPRNMATEATATQCGAYFLGILRLLWPVRSRLLCEKCEVQNFFLPWHSVLQLMSDSAGRTQRRATTCGSTNNPIHRKLEVHIQNQTVPWEVGWGTWRRLCFCSLLHSALQTARTHRRHGATWARVASACRHGAEQ